MGETSEITKQESASYGALSEVEIPPEGVVRESYTVPSEESGSGGDVVVTVQVQRQEPKTEEEIEEEENQRKRQMGGAAVAGGIVGLVVGGPVVAALAGVGAAVAATMDGRVGKGVQKTGEVVASAGDKIKEADSNSMGIGERLQAFNEKHQLTHGASKSIRKGFNLLTKGTEEVEEKK
mmetsp:Transcript_17314/g.40187  ORF Transcript_17314/g.40187 Transcript_17314/m.40187 type:complete len:179 (+) Transcript_17314:112-648(+)|eukprot:CAMPEP_0116846538 /NCGR_PEP_ID=MMETSP0418-20121206/13891_1 /TAXON_ID=1158023 /ORGANISM="Astrosyne radiata, Strain 13vi08-1A" /LENGTH=178 /DNA_ID=CAMNT_0004477797 /DNA_START=84 /DNA_END=620 /DNA_ORIENTATION=-